MPGSKKGARGRIGHREKKVYGLWIWLLVGPAVFFALYWLYSGGPAEKPRERIPPPEKYLQAGEQVSAGGRTLLAAPGGKVIHTVELALGGNRVIAEGGQVFTVIPLVIPEYEGDPGPSRWHLLDGEGRRYDLLKVLHRNPVEGESAMAAGPGSRLVYLVFKIKKDPVPNFLVYTTGEDRWAWKVPGPGETGG